MHRDSTYSHNGVVVCTQSRIHCHQFC
uniref:Uncharacterized protein n=1 Tax=Anguilla anguilla TaxID=7936 RepID=A0A0E9T648_ANGAN